MLNNLLYKQGSSSSRTLTIYARMFRKADSTNRIAIPVESLNKKSSAPRRFWKAELKLSPPNAPPKLEPRCCNRITAISRMERIIWMYGSSGTIDWIIFMPKEHSRKYSSRQEFLRVNIKIIKKRSSRGRVCACA